MLTNRPKPPTATAAPAAPGAKTQANWDTDQFQNPSLRKFLSEVGWNIVSIRRVFLLLTRMNYSDPVNYGRQTKLFQNYYWNMDSAKSTMAIDLDFDFDPTKLEKFPAIFVGTDDVLYRSPVIDDHVQLNEDGSGQEYVYIGSTNVIIRHIGKTGDESMALADLSRNFFKGMRKMMMENGMLSKYEVPRITTSKPFHRNPQQADQWFEADLLITMSFNDPWTIFRESHRIEHINFEANNELAAFVKIP